MQKLENDFKANGGEFREFLLNEIFRIERGTRFVKQERQNGNLPLATAGALNQGIAEFVAPNKIMKEYENHLTIDMFCNCFYRGYRFVCDDNILVLFPKDNFKFNKKSFIYLATIINLSSAHFSYGKQYRQNSFNSHKVSLPINSKGEIAFDFMEQYIAELEAERIAELEAQRIAELEAYLKATGLSDYKLTESETNALEAFNANPIKWQTFKIGELFEIQTTKKKFNATDLSFDGKYPYVARGDSNNGIRGYIDEDIDFLNPANTISFGQDTATMFYQKEAYFTGDKIKVFTFKSGKLTAKTALFLIASAKMSFKYFSWGSSSFNVEILENVNILLPTNSKGEIDFDFIENFITAIQKEVIKNVVLYSEKKLEAYKEVIKA